MIRTLSLLTVSILFHSIAFAQINLTKPLQEPTHTVEPSVEILMDNSASWNMNQALQAGQWNPTMKSIHAPLEKNKFENEEIRQKTEDKLKIDRDRTEPWIDEVGSQRSSSTVSNPIIGESWEGLGVNGMIPPDNAGAISGAGNIVTCINSRIGYFDEQGNNLFDQSLSDFFSPVNAGATVFDPKVEYSKYHNRFIVVALDGNSPSSSRLLFAFSKTSDPMDGFWLYSLVANTCESNVWFDYPNIGVSVQELFVSGNLFNAADDFQQSVVFQLGLDDVWTGGTLSGVIYCDIEENGFLGGNAFTVKPLSLGWGATTNGIILVSCDSGTNDFFYYYINNSLGNSPVLNAYSCSGENSWSTPGNVQQLGSTQLLDGGGTRIRDAFYQNNRIYTVSGADRSDGFGGIMYSEIEYSSGNMLDQVIYGGSGVDYSYPSIEPWGTNLNSWDGTTVIGYLRSNSSIFPQFRAVKHNTNGTWVNDILLKSGESPIEFDRWGDYIDGCIRENAGQAEVWFFGQYGLGDNYGNWVSQLKEFINGCTNSEACNYEPEATNDDGSCEFETCTGCMNSSACNYVPNATIPSLCTYPGCTTPSACNYSPFAGCDNGTCCFDNCVKLIMFDSYSDGWNGATYSFLNGSGDVVSSGTMDSGSEESILTCLPDGCYEFTVTEGSYPSEISWTLETYVWFQLGGVDNTLASGGAGQTQSLTIGGGGEEAGCTNSLACNYDAAAICDNGSCCFSNCLEITMNDSYGDGWNGNIWEVVALSSSNVVASGTLEDGTNGIDYACLDAGCYEFRINTSNGLFINEVSWSLSGTDQVGLSGEVDNPVTFTIDGGADETGCTDVTACNYDNSAFCDNGTCCYGNCGSLWMLDSYGDGWNGSILQITDEMGNIHFETTLTPTMGLGDMYEISVCLDPGCYLVNVSDNTWPEEVSWLLNMGGDGDLANWIIGGGAPENNLVIGVNQAENCFYGCTYPIAVNYDVATFVLFDDGLCEFETCDSSCVGDLNGDSFVNAADLLEFLAVYGTNCII
jgi:hypothetical protein